MIKHIRFAAETKGGTGKSKPIDRLNESKFPAQKTVQRAFLKSCRISRLNSYQRLLNILKIQKNCAIVI